MTDYAQAKVIDRDEAVKRLQSQPRPWAENYLAFYSSWLDGIVVDEPWLMTLPIDDHMVHRGDGVFEGCKCESGRLYMLDRHLKRLEASASAIKLKIPMSLGELESLCVKVVRSAGRRDAFLRIFLSRGPGGFTTNPFECPEVGVYIVVTGFKRPDESRYEKGVMAGISRGPSQSGFFASVKSCNYLHNVLLKREAMVNGWDFAIGVDPDGFITEGSTENIALVDDEGHLVLPPQGITLDGTTLRRAIELSRDLVPGVVHRRISQRDLISSKEVILFGTSLDAMPVTSVEGDVINGGKPGPVAKSLRQLLREDILHNPAMSCPVF